MAARLAAVTHARAHTHTHASRGRCAVGLSRTGAEPGAVRHMRARPCCICLGLPDRWHDMLRDEGFLSIPQYRVLLFYAVPLTCMGTMLTVIALMHAAYPGVMQGHVCARVCVASASRTWHPCFHVHAHTKRGPAAGRGDTACCGMRASSRQRGHRVLWHAGQQQAEGTSRAVACGPAAGRGDIACCGMRASSRQRGHRVLWHAGQLQGRATAVHRDC